MKKNKKNQTERTEPSKESFREGEENLGPHDNMRPDRFPNSTMNKDQRRDAESVLDEDDKDNSDIEKLAADVNTTGSRVTSSSTDDIAGVSDIDRGLGRSRKNR